jgi:Secretion system C-terminal sorting domain
LRNYPNPFKPSTTIQYTLPTAVRVTLEVYDVLGRRVAELVNGHVAAGYHEMTFAGSDLASGIYFYRLNADYGNGKPFTQIGKLMLMK